MNPEASPADRDVHAPVRRSPSASNTSVGTRGLRTKQRILDAALHEFGANGYDRTSLDTIARTAGCSRGSIYQYFASKDDIFRLLAGQAERQLLASMELLDPVTPDASGRASVLGWVSRSATIHTRYGPVFRAIGTSAAQDAVVPGGAAAAGQRLTEAFIARVASSQVPSRQLGSTIGLLISAVNRTLEFSEVLRDACPDIYTPERIDNAAADAVHRTLFGSIVGINSPTPEFVDAPALTVSAELQALFSRVTQIQLEATRGDRRALASLLRVGQEVISSHGYRGTRVDELVKAAGVSRGAFYQYFTNVDDFVQVVAVGAVNELSSVLGQGPTSTDRASVKAWLRQYNTVHATHGVMIRIWLEAVDHSQHGDRAAVVDFGRGRMAHLLGHRSYGDPDIDGIILFAIIEAFGWVPRPDIDVDAAASLVERGLLSAAP